MKEIISLQERLNMVEQELKTLSEPIGSLAKAQEKIADLEQEIKALKVFLLRVHPELKSELPGIMAKL